MADEFDYPGLIPIVPTRESSTLTRQEARLQALEERSNVHSKLMYLSLEECIMNTAGEILMWAMKKHRRSSDEQGLHYFDKDVDVMRMALLASCANGEYGPNPDNKNMASFKEMTQHVIKAGNNTTCNLKSLDRMVRTCRMGIKEWPRLATDYPAQCQILLKYDAYKKLLPESYQSQ